MMQFVSLKAFKTLGSRVTSLGRRWRRHGSGAPHCNEAAIGSSADTGQRRPSALCSKR